jgi:Ca-activated chloride channel family protein
VHDLPGLLPCLPATIKKVAHFIARTEADLGGTEMNRALLSTFKLPPPAALNASLPPGVSGRVAGLVAPQLAQNVLLITDGDIWDVAGVIASAQASGHRVFAIGVGSAPGESLLREMAEQTGGACELVSPNQSVAEVIIRMFRRLRSPRCADLHVDWGTPVQWQSALPLALYGGDTLHLCACAASAPTSAPVLSWVANGAAMQAAANQLQSTESALLPRLVAAQHIAALVQPAHRGQRVPSGESAQLKAAHQALALALRYQLVTDQTNLILVHVRTQADKAEGLPVLAQIAQMQAAGWGGAGSVLQSAGDAFCLSSPMASGPAPHDFPVFYSRVPSVGARLNLSFDLMDCDLAFSAGDDMDDGMDAPAEPAPTVKPAPATKSLRTRRAQQPMPIITPLALLQGFEVDAAAQKTMAETRLIQSLQALPLPPALAPVLDDLAQTLGSDAKAWAVFIQWLADHLADQFSLSRQTERLLRHWLKHVDAAAVADLKLQLTARFGTVQAEDWGV